MSAAMRIDPVHPFEHAGLGTAPFRFVSCFRGKRGCAYCGQELAICFVIRSAEGNTFVVGSDCVRKTLIHVDASLDLDIRRALSDLRAQEREAKREATHKRTMERVAKALETLDRAPDLLTDQPHPFFDHAQKGETLRSYTLWCLRNAGDTGMLAACRTVERAASAQEAV